MHHRQRGAPATAIGTAADRIRIENILKLTRAIGDETTYLTRGIAGAQCLVADALNPAIQPLCPMPSPKQKQLLLALETGVKLHDALREPGMPSKQTLGEWLDNPEFERLYTEATATGQQKRLGGKVAPAETNAPPLPAVLRGQQPQRSPAAQAQASEPSTKLTDSESYQVSAAPEAPAAPLPPVLRSLPIVTEENTHPLAKSMDAAQPARHREADLQTKILDKLRAGIKATSLLTGIPGFNGTKLAAWRKNPDFKRRYDEAKAAGASLVGEQPAADTLPKPADDWKGFTQRVEAHLLAKELSTYDVLVLREINDLDAAEQKLALLLADHRTPAPEPAPNQSEPAPEMTEETPAVDVLKAENQALRDELAGYKEWGDDIKRLTRELDVALFGADAAQQASLCDLIAPARKMAEEFAQLRQAPNGDAGEYFLAVLNPSNKDQKWLNKARAIDDAAYLAMHHNRVSLLVRVVSVTEPAVTVREV